MRLNPECVRAVLLAVEDETDFSHVMQYRPPDKVNTALAGFTHDEIIYHIRQCDASDLLVGVRYYDGGTNIIVKDLSPAGHEFIANTGIDAVWKKIKEKGFASLPLIFEIAKHLAHEHYLG